MMDRRTYILSGGVACLAGCIGSNGETDDTRSSDPSLAERWSEDRYSVDGATPAVAITDDVVLYYTADGIVGLDKGDGTELWKHQELDSLAQFVADGDGVFALSGDGVVYSVNPSDGTTEWTAPTESDGLAGNQLALTERHLVVKSGTGTTSIDRFSGESTATVNTGGRGIIADREMGVASGDGETLAFDVADGTEHWRLDSVVSHGAIGDEGLVLVGGDILGINRQTGEEEWTIAIDRELFDDIGVATTAEIGSVLVGDELYGISLATGETEWSYDMSDVPSPVGVFGTDDVFIIDSSAQTVTLLEADSGEELDSVEPGVVYGADQLDGVFATAGSTVTVYDIR